MVATATAPTQQVVSMQGVAIPATSVDPKEFFRRTRRHIQQESTRVYSGAIGTGTQNNAQATDTFELRKSDILTEITIRVVGTVKITLPAAGDAVATTARWPYDFFKAIRFAANGASNLQNASGLKFKVRDFIKNTDLTDRGVQQVVAGVTRNQGTLAKASESWGVGSATPALAAGTYNVDFEVIVPVAEDQVDLQGAIFLQTNTADLTLAVDYEAMSNLFTTTANGTAQLNLTVQAWTRKYNIPVGANGEIIVPDLSVFHSFIQSNYTALQTGVDNEIRLVGQGAGKNMLRLLYQVWNGAAPGAPLPMTDGNFGLQAWRYATNETPDQFANGAFMRNDCERNYSTDVGGLWGFGVHEFATQNAFRDVVDLATTAELRAVINILNSVALNQPRLEYVMESVFSAGHAA